VSSEGTWHREEAMERPLNINIETLPADKLKGAIYRIRQELLLSMRNINAIGAL
jgi:hypothetical protein